jgi:hypothetical protein
VIAPGLLDSELLSRNTPTGRGNQALTSDVSGRAQTEVCATKLLKTKTGGSPKRTARFIFL